MRAAAQASAAEQPATGRLASRSGQMSMARAERALAFQSLLAPTAARISRPVSVRPVSVRPASW
jgi:hypothetical protein